MNRIIRLSTLGAILLGLAAGPVAAQGRGNSRGKVPPGHLPRAGECRVWYDGRPPGQQPRPTSCREAERTAARTGARVIYGDDRGRYDDRWNRDHDRRGDRRDRDDRARDGRRDRDDRDTRGRAVPRTDRFPGTYPSYPEYPEDRNVRRDGGVLNTTAAMNGYRDGLNKGREDIRDGDSYDPNRHAWYRSADRGYRSGRVSREEYRAEYRDGFLRGYDEAYNNRR